MSQILNTICASNPVDDMPLFLIEIKDDSFVGLGYPDGAIRLCQGLGLEPLTVTLEDNTTAEFIYSGVGVSLPKKGVKGQQDLTFQLDNVTGQAIQAIDAAMKTPGKTEVILRVYALSDLSAPQETPVRMSAVSYRSNKSSVAVTASFHDLVNKSWPYRRYTPDKFPGLKYFG